MEIPEIDNAQRQIELQVLASAKKSLSALSDTVDSLYEYEWTDESLAWIWSKYMAFHKSGELPRIDTIVAMLRMEPSKKQEALEIVLRDVLTATPSTSAKTDCEFLLRCQKHDVVISSIEHANKSLEKGDLDAATTVLEKASNQAKHNGSNLKTVSLIEWDDWGKEPTAVQGIPTGFQRLDEELMGGGTKGEVCLIMGNTNMGKSILGVNFGASAVFRNYRVWHIDTENGEDITRWRYVGRLTGKATKSLQRRKLQQSMEGWARRNKERIDKFLRITNIGVSATTLDEVIKERNKLAKLGFTPDMIVFDSPDQTAITGSSDNIALQNKLLYERLKGWVHPKQANAFLVAVIQAKESAEGKIASSKHAAWGYDKARLADIIVSINPPLNERGQPVTETKMGNKRSLFVAKARSASSRFMIKVTTAFEVAKITQDSGGDDLEGEGPEEQAL